MKYTLVHKMICAIRGHNWHIESCSYQDLSSEKYVFYSAKCLNCGVERKENLNFFTDSGSVIYAENLQRKTFPD